MWKLRIKIGGLNRITLLFTKLFFKEIINSEAIRTERLKNVKEILPLEIRYVRSMHVEKSIANKYILPVTINVKSIADAIRTAKQTLKSSSLINYSLRQTISSSTTSSNSKHRQRHLKANVKINWTKHLAIGPVGHVPGSRYPAFAN